MNMINKGNDNNAILEDIMINSIIGINKTKLIRDFLHTNNITPFEVLDLILSCELVYLLQDDENNEIKDEVLVSLESEIKDLDTIIHEFTSNDNEKLSALLMCVRNFQLPMIMSNNKQQIYIFMKQLRDDVMKELKGEF